MPPQYWAPGNAAYMQSEYKVPGVSVGATDVNGMPQHQYGPQQMQQMQMMPQTQSPVQYAAMAPPAQGFEVMGSQPQFASELPAHPGKNIIYC